MAQYYVHTAKGRKRKTLYGKTRAEAAKKLSRALSQRADGQIFDDQGLTVGEYLDRWLGDVRDTVRKSTHERYEYAIRPHIKPALGGIKLKDLTPVQVRWFYRERLDSGLAPATVHKLHAVLHKALKAAVADGLVPRNAAAGLKLPRIVREELDPLTEDQARHLLETLRGDRLEALYVLALKYRSFNPLIERAKLRPIRFHDLRHTCATLLLNKDVNPKIVSEMLGHSSISVTLDIYSHLLPDMQEKAAKALEEALS